MNCPKCHSSEIDSGGFCLVCGLRTTPPEELARADEATPAGISVPADEASRLDATPVVQADLPEWRQELSRRLQEIKSRREGDGNALLSAPPDAAADAIPSESAPSEAVSPEALPAVATPTERDLKPGTARPSGVRKPRRIPRAGAPEQPPPPAEAPVEERAVEETSKPVETKPEAPESAPSHFTDANTVVRTSPLEVDARRKQYTQDLIDSVVARLGSRETQSAPLPPIIPPLIEQPPEPHTAPARATEPSRKAESNLPSGLEWKPALRPEPDSRRAAAFEAAAVQAHEPGKPEELPEAKSAPAAPDLSDDKLILLSRTLAGLVDLIVVLLCAVLIIMGADVAAGIEVLDATSQIHYAVLFLILFVAYSLFFLGMAGQTIGMMLTDLRLLGNDMRRAPFGRVTVRCLVYLPGLALMGIGLVWGVFDRHARCLHDLMSDTRVVRVVIE